MMTGSVRVTAIALLMALMSCCGPSSTAFAQQEPLGTIAYNPNPLFGGEVRLTQPDGSGDQRIPVDLVSADFPVWSRDGLLIAVTGLRTAEDQASLNIFVFDPTEGHAQQVTQNPNDPVYTFVPLFKAFSRDGKRLAVTNFFASRSSTGSPPELSVSLLVFPL